MAKTGGAAGLGTAEGALLWRAAHALYAPDPVLDDFWAVELLAPQTRAALRDRDAWLRAQTPEAQAFAPVGAVGVGSLRWAEDELGRAAGEGVDQYVVLGAGFDSLALRRADLAGRVRVFEVDHPDVQALKRERIAAAERTPAALPVFVPVDFERDALSARLLAAGFDPRRRAFFSWLNTLPYLTAAAVEATLDEIAKVAAGGSRLVLNYGPEVALTPEQAALAQRMRGYAAAVGEGHQPPWKAGALEALLAARGFAPRETLTEQDLERRYFRARADGLRPGLPARLLLAERRA